MNQLAILLVAALAAAACDSSVTGVHQPLLLTGNNTGSATAGGVFIDPSNIGLSVGGSAQLSARAVDANGAAITGTIAWVSSNTGVATVDASGRVQGVGPGTTVITASVNGRSGSAIVSVT